MTATSSALVVRAGQDRFGNVNMLGADQNLVKLSARDTDERLSLFEWLGRAPGGPPLHVHPDQDETFIVLEGTYSFQCGAERHRLNPRDSIFLPRGVPHTFRQESNAGRLLFIFTPAGDMEAFFAAAAGSDGPPSPALFNAHGMEVVGPPIEPD